MANLGVGRGSAELPVQFQQLDELGAAPRPLGHPGDELLWAGGERLGRLPGAEDVVLVPVHQDTDAGITLNQHLFALLLLSQDYKTFSTNYSLTVIIHEPRDKDTILRFNLTVLGFEPNLDQLFRHFYPKLQ